MDTNGSMDADSDDDDDDDGLGSAMMAASRGGVPRHTILVCTSHAWSSAGAT